MAVWEMREALLKAYSTDSWKIKVKNMSDNQVIAVFNRLRYSGRIKW